LPPPLLVSVQPEPAHVDDRTGEQERDPGQRVWRVVPPRTHLDAPPWVVGKLVHDALAAWRFPAPDWPFERWAEAQARGYGLIDPHQLADAVTKGRCLLLRFREYPLYAGMAVAGQRMHEVPYSRINDGQVESGVVDALYLLGGVWTIVEFKTDNLPDQAALEKLLAREDYLLQARRYREAVQQLVGQQPEVVFCFLDYAGAVHLHRL
jgi:ATP-dependent exoDNAse (exonuclease V) beta subunit